MAVKQKLVVIGNGMAGARFVEDLLARGGGEQFEIVMFGDEPYGNYNRILLSGVLSGTHQARDIFINPLAWYDENDITLHAGSKVRKADLMVTVDTHEEALKYIGRFMQYYRENAKYLERTYDFVEWLGIEKVRQVVVEDSEGIAAGLDAEIEAAVDSYVDPWLEAARPHHPSQFVNILSQAEVDARLRQIATKTPSFGD